MFARHQAAASRFATPRIALIEAVSAFVAALLSLVVVAPLLYRLLGLPAMAITQLVFIAGPVVLVVLAREGFRRRAAQMLGLRNPGARKLFGALLIGLSFWYVNLLFVAPIARKYLRGLELEKAIDQTILGGDTPMYAIILIVGLFPAVCEELLMRGALTRSLGPRFGRTGAVVISALMFGAMHLHPAQMLTTFTFGLMLGAATIATDSVWPAIVMHFLNNALVLLIGGEAIPAVTETLRDAPLAWGSGAIILCLSGCLLLFWRGRPGAAAGEKKPS